MTEQERWAKVEEIVERVVTSVVKRELAAAGLTKNKLEFVNGRWTGITEQQLTVWREAFPGVDVDAELKKMAAWIVGNPMTAPKSQMGRFVNSWLTKCQNQASLRSIPTGRPLPNVATPNLCEYCLKPAAGSVNGIRHCSQHTDDAMYQKPRQKMPGIPAKAVAGSD